MKPSSYYITLLLLISLMSIRPGLMHAQVSISPTLVTLKDDQPMRTLTLTNTTATALEVSIDAAFGYPVTNQNGVIGMEYGDGVREQQFALDPHLRFFPRRFVLQPGERQLVRIQLLPETTLGTNQMYWTRLRISSNEVETDADLTSDLVVSRIRYRIQQNIGVFLHNGEVFTGVHRSGNVQLIRNESDIPMLLIPFEQVGNAPFMGQYTYSLTDASGREVWQNRRTFSVYFQRVLAVELGDGSLPPGVYRLRVQTGNDRQDVPAADRVPVQSDYEEVFTIRI